MASYLCFTENDRPLGPRHFQHEPIEREGRGRYSHWNGALLFSTSDGSDPNTNGRVYRAYCGVRTPHMLAFGSCHVHGAIDNLEVRSLAYSIRRTPYLTFTPRETLQLIEFDLGRLQIPAAFQPFAVPRDAIKVLPEQASNADFLFLEFTQAIDVACGDFFFMRRAVAEQFVAPFAKLGPQESRIANRWYQHGLVQRDEVVRVESARRLLEMLPRADVDQALMREVLTSAHGTMQTTEEFASSMAQIRELLGIRNVAVISAPNLYLPDGRPVGFPVNFLKELEQVCGELRMPVLRLADLVAARGGKFALEDDLHHFTPGFMDYLADQLLALTRRAPDSP